MNAQSIRTLNSPDGKIGVSFQIAQDGCLNYSLKFEKKVVINPSRLGFEIDAAAIIPDRQWSIVKIDERTNNSIWKPVWGKRAVVNDLYNEVVFEMEGKDAAVLNLLTIEARAYNDGIAIRYRIPKSEQAVLVPLSELTEYRFSDDYTAWFYNGEYPNIGPEQLSESSGKRFPVMTVKVNNDAYLAIHEADLEFGQPLVLQSTAGSTTFSVASKPDKLEAGYHSAWRVILCGNSPGALVDSHLIELLNPEPSGDFSWVKPGVSVWDWRIDGAKIDGFTYGMNYLSWVRMIDFASENNILYLVLDANWYGPESDSKSNPLDDKKSQDVIRIIQYGKQKGVGVWLYLNDVAGRKYPIEKTLKQYADWGAAGIKYGFMNGSPLEKNGWTRKITGLCAQNHLLCDFHDGPVHPYGQMRTFPNALTREFCHAQLDAHRVFVPKTFVTTVFVNMLAGPIDMNNGMFDLRQGNTTRTDENKQVPSTVVSEAARTLIVFSGATIIPDIPEYYHKYPDLLKFIALQKMPWQESKTLAGEIGEYIVMARQAASGVWLIGAATNESPRELDIPLSFLKPGKFEVTVIQDGENAHYLTNREVMKTKTVMKNSSETVRVQLAAGGGACLLIMPNSLKK